MITTVGPTVLLTSYFVICALSMNSKDLEWNTKSNVAMLRYARKTLFEKGWSQKKVNEIAALHGALGGRQSVVPIRENNKETLANLFILS